MMLDASFGDLYRAGCIQCKSMILFAGLMLVTGGDPCETGCANFQNGKCKIYQEYHSVPKKQRREKEEKLRDATTPNNGTGFFAGMTMKQIAKAEKISLKEARRRKMMGEYGRD